jgi:PAS domain S-box-containing protein
MPQCQTSHVPDCSAGCETVGSSGLCPRATELESFFSLFPTALAVWDFDGRVRRANSHFDRLIGFSFAERQGRSVFDFAHPDDMAAVTGTFRKLLAEGEITGFECRMRCKDGSYRWLLLNASTVPSEKLIYVAAHEITQRKHAEEALRRSEALFRSAFENPLFGMAFVALDGNFLQVNQGMCRITGFGEQELLRTRVESITHPEDVPKVEEFRHTMMAGVASSSVGTKRYVRKDGSEVWASVHVALIRDAEGKPLHFLTVVEDLSEQKRAELALRQSQEWLAYAQGAAGVGVWDWDADTGETRASDEQFRLYGLNPGGKFPFGEDFMHLIHPGDRERVARDVDSAMTGVCNYESRFRVVWPDASVHWLLARGRVFGDGTGLAARFIGANVDITERVRAESTLKEFFDLSPAPLAIVGFDGHIRQANQALIGTAGLTIEELQQRPFVEFFHPEDREAITGQFLTVVGNGEGAALEARGLVRDGSVIWLLLTLAAVQDEELVYITGYDVTTRKLADEALRQSEHRFRLIAETIQEVFWIANVQLSAIRYVSPGYERIWGRPTQELYEHPRSFIDSIHPDDRERVLAHFEREKQGLPLDHEYRILRPDGTLVWIWDRGFPVLDEAGKPDFYVGIAQDITERKRMEEEIRAHSEKLVRSNAELERFAYVASHDLQEPLRMVASFTQLLSKRYSGRLDETADRYIHYAVDGAKRMQELISDLLAYSRVNNKELDLQQTDCEAVVTGATRNLQVAIEESGASIDWDPLPALIADPGQLTQLFQNLLANAIKFRRTEESPRVHISVVDNGPEWLLSVQDNGIGIDPNQAERVFQIFQRLHTRTEYPGTGIGLAVCKKVVERHGGRIWVESQPGAGSNFRFTLPKNEERKITDGTAQ